MRNLIPILIGSIALAGSVAQAAPRLEPEAQLARAIGGRVAGAPVSCINLRTVRSTRIIDDTAIVFEAGSTLYVNRPEAGREDLNSWDTLVTKTPTSQLCSVDTVRMYDSGLRMPRGVVFLGKFVPYRRVRSD